FDHVAERRLQRCNIEPAREPNRQRDRVGRARTFKPVEEPQSALRIRQRYLRRTHPRQQRRPRRRRQGQTLRQSRNRRRFEQTADRDFYLKARPDPADQPRRQQRMPPKRKEIIIDADIIDTENLRKQPAKDRLPRVARSAPRRTPSQLRRRQAGPGAPAAWRAPPPPTP